MIQYVKSAVLFFYTEKGRLWRKDDNEVFFSDTENIFESNELFTAITAEIV
jgi:hypothetical protein